MEDVNNCIRCGTEQSLVGVHKPKKMEEVEKYYNEQSKEILEAFISTGTTHTVKIMLFEFTQKQDQRIKELEEGLNETHLILEKVHKTMLLPQSVPAHKQLNKNRELLNQ